MKSRLPWVVAFMLGVAIILISVVSVSADDDEHRHRNRHGDRGNERREDDDDYEHAGNNWTSVDNPTYTEHCGACHAPYQPDLLPSGSWEKILSNLENHNGTEVAIEPEARTTIAQYLETNSADQSASRRSRKIMRSLNGQTPTRITDVPYIRHQHHDIPIEVFQRKSVGSRSNCPACHPSAERGIFDDDQISIPD